MNNLSYDPKRARVLILTMKVNTNTTLIKSCSLSRRTLGSDVGHMTQLWF